MKKRMIRLLAALCLIFCLSVQVFALPKTLIPGGCTVGIKLCTKGLVVTGFEKHSAAQSAGLRKGDVIIQVDGEAVHTAAALRESLEKEQVILTVLRDGREAEFCVRPAATDDGMRLGAYIRDSMAGIGTVTYYDPNTGEFGALGHGVNDADASILMPLEAGVVVGASVSEVRKGVSGTPGELKGKFDVNAVLGEVEANTEHGIFGTLTTPVPGKPIPVAAASEVEPGEAVILANISGKEVEEYTVEILRIYPQATDTGRNLLLQITDQRLLDATGGIVQGMGVIDNRDNTKKPVNKGFFAVTLKNEPNIGV
ncbi:MAG: SpoIVB peptidase S55 domain-containing protein [Fusicatenibacter sp.]